MRGREGGWEGGGEGGEATEGSLALSHRRISFSVVIEWRYNRKTIQNWPFRIAFRLSPAVPVPISIGRGTRNKKAESITHM